MSTPALTTTIVATETVPLTTSILIGGGRDGGGSWEVGVVIFFVPPSSKPASRSLAYKLADAGYDVWLSNVRGNTWSHGHSELDVCPNCTRYWRFGFDEVGRYDLPALVDGVLSATGGDELFAVGYSMSTTAHLVALAERPEYNGKVRAGFMMGPAAIMGASVTPFTPLIQYADDFFQVLESIGAGRKINFQ